METPSRGGRHLLRGLAKSPSFSLTVLLTLGIGIRRAAAVDPAEALAAE